MSRTYGFKDTDFVVNTMQSKGHMKKIFYTEHDLFHHVVLRYSYLALMSSDYSYEQYSLWYILSL